MNPAYSVIFFTVASGAGFGLIAWVAVATALTQRAAPLTALVVGVTLALAGLASSFGHLGRPERAWRAFSQWRTSWLSREAVAAVAALSAAAVLALVWMGWVDLAWRTLALVAAVLALITVWCTAMIYASLRTIPNWNLGWVPWNYLAFAVASGGVLFAASDFISGTIHPVVAYVVGGAVLIAWGLKLAYWRSIDADRRLPSVAAALGLPEYDRARLFEGPATRPTYVQREMGYRVARKHALRLRRISAGTALATVSLLLAAPQSGPLMGTVWTVLASVVMFLGLLIERWLFFAQAEHVAMRYY